MTDMYDNMSQEERDIVDNYFEKEAKDGQNRISHIKSVTSESSGNDAILGASNPTWPLN
jgi:hypothetical protein